MVALLALTLALAAVGCAQKKAEEPAVPAMEDTTSMTQDSMPMDTAAVHQ